MFHPDTMYDIVKSHHQDLRDAAENHRIAKLARGEQRSAIKAAVLKIIAFTRSDSEQPQPIEITQTGEILRLSNDQA